MIPRCPVETLLVRTKKKDFKTTLNILFGLGISLRFICVQPEMDQYHKVRLDSNILSAAKLLRVNFVVKLRSRFTLFPFLFIT